MANMPVQVTESLDGDGNGADTGAPYTSSVALVPAYKLNIVGGVGPL